MHGTHESLRCQQYTSAPKCIQMNWGWCDLIYPVCLTLASPYAPQVAAMLEKQERVANGEEEETPPASEAPASATDKNEVCT